MKSYKIVFILPAGKYTMTNVTGENVLVAIGRAAAEIRKKFPLYPYDVFSIERTDLPIPSKIEGSDFYLGYEFDGNF